MGIVKDNGRGDVCAGDDKDDRAESAARGEGIGKRLDGVNGVAKVGVVGGRVRGVMPRGLPATAVTCCGGVVEVADVLWLKVAVASVASVSSTLESCGLEVLEVLLPSDITTVDIWPSPSLSDFAFTMAAADTKEAMEFSVGLRRDGEPALGK